MYYVRWTGRGREHGAGGRVLQATVEPRDDLAEVHACGRQQAIACHDDGMIFEQGTRDVEDDRRLAETGSGATPGIFCLQARRG